MLQDYFEPFTLLRRAAVPDLMGGEGVSWQPSMAFYGALTQTAGMEKPVGGRMTVHQTPVLVHELDVPLHPGDCVRREQDGCIWRVAAHGGDMRTPAFSSLCFGQVPVERWVIPC